MYGSILELFGKNTDYKGQ
uniref:Uncharacterized protein n=1 Tax=Arundo donax TaxID=35708 RepID=A0A0A9FEF6_ARUDO